MRQTCGDCRWWDRDYRTENKGDCVVNPPHVVCVPVRLMQESEREGEEAFSVIDSVMETHYPKTHALCCSCGKFKGVVVE